MTEATMGQRETAYMTGVDNHNDLQQQDMCVPPVDCPH
jgi:hypothetical protein